jgi:hypothetical protein
MPADAGVIAAYIALVSVLGGLLSTRASLGPLLVATVVVAVLPSEKLGVESSARW